MRQVREQVALFTPTGPQGIQLWANSATQELAALAQEFGFRLNRVAPLDGSENFTSQVTFEAGIKILDSTGADSAVFSHDGTDFNSAFTNTTDWNITGVTAINAGTADADFDAITATSYGGITEVNLLDKSAVETVTGNWTFTGDLTVDHNGNTGGVSSGTYTPTLTNGANVDGTTAFQCQWMRVGNVITVSGRISINPTSAATLTAVNMSLPVAALFETNEECGGVGRSFHLDNSFSIRGHVVSEDALIEWVNPSSTDNTGFFFIFMYEI